MTPAGPRTVFVVKDDDPVRAALGTRELTILWRLRAFPTRLRPAIPSFGVRAIPGNECLDGVFVGPTDQGEKLRESHFIRLMQREGYDQARAEHRATRRCEVRVAATDQDPSSPILLKFALLLILVWLAMKGPAAFGRSSRRRPRRLSMRLLAVLA